MSAHVPHIDTTENNFITMTIMCAITLVCALFSITGLVIALVPYFHLAALGMTIYVGYRTIQKDKKRRNENKKTF
jgi:uncharacterized membrane protein